jgi:hypothetical protein
MAQKSISVSLNFDRETKNTRRYIEQDAQGEPVATEDAKIGTIYVPKATLAALGDAEAKSVTVAVSL